MLEPRHVRNTGIGDGVASKANASLQSDVMNTLPSKRNEMPISATMRFNQAAGVVNVMLPFWSSVAQPLGKGFYHRAV